MVFPLLILPDTAGCFFGGFIETTLFIRGFQLDSPVFRSCLRFSRAPLFFKISVLYKQLQHGCLTFQHRSVLRAVRLFAICRNGNTRIDERKGETLFFFILIEVTGAGCSCRFAEIIVIILNKYTALIALLNAVHITVRSDGGAENDKPCLLGYLAYQRLNTAFALFDSSAGEFVIIEFCAVNHPDKTVPDDYSARRIAHISFPVRLIVMSVKIKQKLHPSPPPSVWHTAIYADFVFIPHFNIYRLTLQYLSKEKHPFPAFFKASPRNSDGAIAQSDFPSDDTKIRRLQWSCRLGKQGDLQRYGDEAACIIVDERGKLVLDDVYNGFDDDTLRLLDLEVKEVPEMPDPVLSVQDMKDYGYAWAGVLPAGQEAAEKALEKGCEVYRLYSDNTEGLCVDAKEIANHAAKGGMLGISKESWMAALEKENYLKAAEMSMEDDYGMIDGIINNGPKEDKTAEVKAPERGEKSSIMDRLKSVKAEKQKECCPPKKHKGEIEL